MVLRGEMTITRRRRRAEQRPKNLHNFTLPNLKWGRQRQLKCMKIGSSTSSSDHRLRRHRSSNGNNNSQHRRALFKSGEEEEWIEEFRVRIMSDLKTVRDKITRSMYALKEHQHEQEQRKAREVSPVKAWNLRKRRAAGCKETVSANGFGAIEEKTVNPSPPTRGGEVVVVVEGETTMRPKFSVNLSKKEIEEDFMAALGHRPPRRPKKRPRTVQKKLDSLHPGFYLPQVTLDAYKVPEQTKSMQR